MQRLNIETLPSPCYVVDQAAIEANLRIIEHVQRQSGAQVLLALKGFALWKLFPLIARYLDGVAASSLHEAMLGAEKFAKQLHVYSPAYRDDEFDKLANLADHLIFNSFTQRQHYKDRTQDAACGIRINPQYSQVKTPKYDPCAPHCRLGVTLESFKDQILTGISGLHFHTMCELNSDALQRTVTVVEQKFGRYFDKLSWINFGGGHHITRRDYDIDLLIDVIVRFTEQYRLKVFLEPSEAIALNAGVLVATVLDIVRNDMDIAILDTSATTHMPDVLEMPYRPLIEGAGEPGEKKVTYRLGGMTCLAGDVIGDYSFDRPLRVGDRLLFEDMAHYTMVKNTTFNGMCLPAIAIHDSLTGQTQVVRQFSYEDYRKRLA